MGLKEYFDKQKEMTAASKVTPFASSVLASMPEKPELIDADIDYSDIPAPPTSSADTIIPAEKPEGLISLSDDDNTADATTAATDERGEDVCDEPTSDYNDWLAHTRMSTPTPSYNPYPIASPYYNNGIRPYGSGNRTIEMNARFMDTFAGINDRSKISSARGEYYKNRQRLVSEWTDRHPYPGTILTPSAPICPCPDDQFDKWIDNRVEKLSDICTISEAKLLNYVNISSTKEEVEAYINTLMKLVDAGVFDDKFDVEAAKKADEEVYTADITKKGEVK